MLATSRRDGRPQLSPVTVAVDEDGRVLISSRETAFKVRNLSPSTASVCCSTDAFYGPWVQLEGDAEIVAAGAHRPAGRLLPRISGEHPDWDDYRAAMARDQRVSSASTSTAPGLTGLADTRTHASAPP